MTVLRERQMGRAPTAVNETLRNLPKLEKLTKLCQPEHTYIHTYIHTYSQNRFRGGRGGTVQLAVTRRNLPRFSSLVCRPATRALYLAVGLRTAFMLGAGVGCVCCFVGWLASVVGRYSVRRRVRRGWVAGSQHVSQRVVRMLCACACRCLSHPGASRGEDALTRAIPSQARGWRG